MIPVILAAVLAIYVSLGDGIPYLLLLFALLALLADLVMRRTRYGA